MGQLQEIEEKLTVLGYQVLAVSPDTPENVKRIEGQRSYGYRLFSDTKLEAMAKMGIVYKVDDAMLEKYKGYGIDLEAASGETHHLLPVPSLFIVDTEGQIRFAYVDPVYQRRIDPDTLLAAAKHALN